MIKFQIKKENITLKDNLDVFNPFIEWKDTNFPDYIMKSIVD